jgi:hypothetical protein
VTQEEDDSDLELMQLMGGWRILCSVMLSDAIKLVAKKRITKYNNGCGPTEDDRLASQRWIKGGVGAITFEQCCAMLGQDPERARKMIDEWCKRPASSRRVRGLWQVC